MRFEFATAARIIFGQGSVNEVPAIASQAKSTILITGRKSERAGVLLEQLNKSDIKHIIFAVKGEPTISTVEDALNLAGSNNCDLVISIGGGSVIDTGKAVAAMLTNPGKVTDYLEVVGLGKAIVNQPARHIAIPTTAGTGAEVTRNAVLAVPEKKVKVSMRDPMMLPSVAIVDPELTYSMTPTVTASTGLDAMTQLMEAYLSNKANTMTDALCIEGLRRASLGLKTAYLNGDNTTARQDMSLASLFGGLALANAGLGAVHGLAGPLGGMIQIPHGIVCGRLLPFVMQANLLALKNRLPESPALIRYDDIAKFLTGNPKASAADGLAWVQELCNILEIPALSEFGLQRQDFFIAAAKAQASSSMKGNPIELTHEELVDILKKAF